MSSVHTFSTNKIVATLLLLLFHTLFAFAGVVLDFEKFGPHLAALEESGFDVISIEGLSNSKQALPGAYEVRVANDIVLYLVAGQVNMTLEYERLDLVSDIRFSTKNLSLGEAQALAEEFHANFDLNDTELKEWLGRIREGREFLNYSRSNVEHYPAIGIMLIRTFHPTEPLRIQFSFQWDSITTKRRGTSKQNNKLSGIYFDTESILERFNMEQERLEEILDENQILVVSKDIDGHKEPDEEKPESDSLVEK